MQKYNSGIRVTEVTKLKLAAFWSLNYFLAVQEKGKDNRVKISGK